MTFPLTSPDAPVVPNDLHGVYRPQEDTCLLIDALSSVDFVGAKMLDLCTGSGAVAIAGALRGADVTAVDSCPHAVDATRLAAVQAGVALTVSRSDVAAVEQTGFDLVTCNPPYVPTPPGTEASAVGPSHAWNAGPNGRAVLDVVCAVLPRLLAEDGTALVVQSELADVDATVAALRGAGLRAKVVRERLIPFGPVVESRRELLVRKGFLDPTSEKESIVVIRAQRAGRSPREAT
ncbi:methyltransferase [Gordonia sp. PDNC005]|uniref:HemK2/MTQ2 family protein methyltransferase n=1 Tax=unclassified Gordonia (in: high G+C Gram-positive bacteria) TaxID=2657482 RepID=UPI0019665E84|nr:HemK2/MTQ2 family protein methyltransferase [Gordonia sp. PDNC005]QRY61294.1 methyltransferase [Gordonia sp. PDNC005]